MERRNGQSSWWVGGDWRAFYASGVGEQDEADEIGGGKQHAQGQDLAFGRWPPFLSIGRTCDERPSSALHVVCEGGEWEDAAEGLRPQQLLCPRKALHQPQRNISSDWWHPLQAVTISQDVGAEICGHFSWWTLFLQGQNRRRVLHHQTRHHHWTMDPLRHPRTNASHQGACWQEDWVRHPNRGLHTSLGQQLVIGFLQVALSFLMLYGAFYDELYGFKLRPHYYN